MIDNEFKVYFREHCVDKKTNKLNKLGSITLIFAFISAYHKLLKDMEVDYASTI